MSGFKKQKGSLGTAVKWDGIYRGGDLEREGEEVRSRAFRSSRTKRYEFGKQDKKQFQDEEDLVSELAHLEIRSNYKDLTGGLDIRLKGYEEIRDAAVPDIGGNTGIEKKSRKKKVKVAYHYEDEDEQDVPELDIKLKSVDSKMKFQKNIPKIMNKQTTSKQITDPIYKSFIKKLHPVIPKTESIIPHDYQPKYTLSHSNALPLSKNAATSLLSSRFTSTNSPSPPSTQQRTTSQQPQRTVLKIEVSQLLKKRLGL